MDRTIITQFIAMLLLATSNLASAGPYAPADGWPGSTAVDMADPAIIAWAAGWTNYTVGYDCDQKWQTPERALGVAAGNSTNIVCLGEGGEITMVFEEPIQDGPGNDLAVFENSPNDYFLELAYCEVSSDGENFVRFPNHSLTPDPVSQYGSIDPTDIDGLASKYQQGYGTPFDLAQLQDPNLDIDNVSYVRIVDIIGDGSHADSYGNPIYDPYPNMGSAGFDLDAIATLSNAVDEVSIVAASDAKELGPQSGAFTLRRKSWDNSSSLNVEIAISGTASNGVDYATLPAEITIPAGSSTVPIAIDPLEDILSEGSENVSLAIVPSETYLNGQQTTASIFIADRPIDHWKSIVFGSEANSPAAEDTADYDGDGTSNILEYALGTDPKQPNPPAMRIATRIENGETKVLVSYKKSTAATDVEIVMKSVDSLSESASDGWQIAECTEDSMTTESAGSLTVESESDTDSADSQFFKLEAHRL